MKVYRAEWPDEDECDYHFRIFDTLKQAQDFARKKSRKIFVHTYVVESQSRRELLDQCGLAQAPEISGPKWMRDVWLEALKRGLDIPGHQDVRQWVYAGGGLSYKEGHKT